MPFYIFQSNKTGEIREIFFHMNDVKTYLGENGKEINIWERQFVVPQASVDAKIDPCDNKAFIEKTGKNKGKLGDVLDRSKELSQIRAEKRDGKDPVREKYLEKWKSERKNRKIHPSEVHRNVEIVAGE